MKTKLNWFDRIMLGVNFAEANLPNIAVELMNESGKEGRGSVAREEQNRHPYDSDASAKVVRV